MKRINLSQFSNKTQELIKKELAKTVVAKDSAELLADVRVGSARAIKEIQSMVSNINKNITAASEIISHNSAGATAEYNIEVPRGVTSIWRADMGSINMAITVSEALDEKTSEALEDIGFDLFSDGRYGKVLVW